MSTTRYRVETLSADGECLTLHGVATDGARVLALYGAACHAAAAGDTVTIWAPAGRLHWHTLGAQCGVTCCTGPDPGVDATGR